MFWLFFFLLSTELFFLFALFHELAHGLLSAEAIVVQKAIKSTIHGTRSGELRLCHSSFYYCAIQVVLKPLPMGMLRKTEELLEAKSRLSCHYEVPQTITRESRRQPNETACFTVKKLAPVQMLWFSFVCVVSFLPGSLSC